MIEIKQVKNKRQIKDFVDFPLKLYKNCEYFVPPLYADEKRLFRKNTTYSDQAQAIYFVAYKDGKAVGRISGIIQRASNTKWNQKRVRFTRFDSIEDKEVAFALFDAVEAWGKDNGMEEIVGPLGFSDLEREGLLIEGFNELSTFEEQYNYPYYQELVEEYGFKKEVDWLEHILEAPTRENFDRVTRLSSLMLKRYGLHFAKCRTTNEFLRKYSDAFFEILDKTYVNIYGTVPFTQKTKRMLINSFKLIVNLKYVAVILDKDDNVVCFGICFPSIAKAVQKSGGKLTLSAIGRILKSIKKPEVIDLGLIGVLPEYAMKGVSTAILAEVMKMLTSGGIKYAETNLNLETNANILNQWKVFNHHVHKRRRAYVKKIV